MRPSVLDSTSQHVVMVVENLDKEINRKADHSSRVASLFCLYEEEKWQIWDFA